MDGNLAGNAPYLYIRFGTRVRMELYSFRNAFDIEPFARSKTQTNGNVFIQQRMHVWLANLPMAISCLFLFFFCFFALGIVDYEIVVRRPLNGAMNSLRHAIFFSFYCVEFGCILFSFRWGLGV